MKLVVAYRDCVFQEKSCLRSFLKKTKLLAKFIVYSERWITLWFTPLLIRQHTETDSPWRRQAASCCTASGRAGPSRESLGCRSGPARPGGRRWSLPCCGFRGDAVLAPPPLRPAARLGSSHRSSSLGPAGGYWTADWTSEWRWDLRECASQQRGLSKRAPKALQRLSFFLSLTHSGRNSGVCGAARWTSARLPMENGTERTQSFKTLSTTNFSGRLQTT